MSRDLQIDVPFTSNPQEIALRMQERARQAGAKMDLGDSGLDGTFLLKKLLLTIVKGSFQIVPNVDSGGVARIEVTEAAGFITDDQIRDELTKMFSGMEA